MRDKGYPFWWVVLTGYLIGGRYFAYVGFSPLFIGEVYLGCSVLRNRGNWLGTFVGDCLRLQPLSIALALNLGWGIFEVFRALFMGQAIIEVLRIFAFNYYPLYLLIGIAWGREVSLPRFIQLWKALLAAWSLAGLAHMTILKGSAVDWFYPAITPMVPVITIALWEYLKGWWPRYPLVILALLQTVGDAGRGRGALLGLIFGLTAVTLAGQARLFRLVAIIITLVVGLYAVAPLFPPDAEWATAIDPVSHVAGLIATSYPDVAIKMMRERGHVTQGDVIMANEGTAMWRKKIWHNAIKSLDSTELIFLGHGGGASIVDLVPDGQDIHTPHNFTIFVLYYMGGMGLAVYSLLLFVILLASRSLPTIPFRAATCGAIWSSLLVAVTGNCYETPMGAIPLYLGVGIMMGVSYRHAAVLRRASARTGNNAAQEPKRTVAAAPRPLRAMSPGRPAMATRSEFVDPFRAKTAPGGTI